MKVAYLCDKKACKICSNPTGDEKGCNHTLDISHAKNFEVLDKTLVMEKLKESK